MTSLHSVFVCKEYERADRDDANENGDEDIEDFDENEDEAVVDNKDDEIGDNSDAADVDG